MKPNNELRVLITGGDGLLGTYLHKCLLNSEINCLSLGREELDITSLENIDRILMDYRPNVIVNCAAYTNVEKAETDRDVCFSVNVSGVINLIQKSNEYNCKLIQISTDFVFDGVKESGIYIEDDIPNPINYYGLTKYMAESEIINSSIQWCIIRTAWLYGEYNLNFVNKIIDLAKTNNSIIVTNRETGSPTYAKDLADSILTILINNDSGLLHITNNGFTTRFDFAKKIIHEMKLDINIVAGNYSNNLVKRPIKVKLESTSNRIKLRQWESALFDYLQEKFKFKKNL